MSYTPDLSDDQKRLLLKALSLCYRRLNHTDLTFQHLDRFRWMLENTAPFAERDIALCERKVRALMAWARREGMLGFEAELGRLLPALVGRTGRWTSQPATTPARAY